jgi:hypothetical protein
MVLLHKNSTEQKGLKYLQAGLDSLEGIISRDRQICSDSRFIIGETRSARFSGLLPDFVLKRRWRGEISCYFRIYMACYWAGLANWTETKRYIDELRTAVRKFEVPMIGALGQLALYLDGIYHQGIGDFNTALQIFGDPKLNLNTAKGSVSTTADQVQRDTALLAALNSLWILQDEERRNYDTNVAMMEKLEPLCVNHPNLDIRTAFHLSGATIEKNPPLQLIDIKSSLRSALDCAQSTANTQFLAMTLGVMCSRFFNGVLGAQAEKSAMAASVQATRSGNALWQSVADGMLAKCYDVQGKKDEAQRTWAAAYKFAEAALPSV